MKILSILLLIFLHLGSSIAMAQNQLYNTYIGADFGISATYSYWASAKPYKYDYRLQPISQAAPNFRLALKKRVFTKMWVDIGVKAQPVSWKKSTYYYSSQYLRRTKNLRTMGVWQFPITTSWVFGKGLFKEKFPSHWALETGFMVSLRNPKADLNLGSLSSGLSSNTNPLYDNGALANYLIPIGISYSLLLPNEKLLVFGTKAVFGTKIAFQEFVTENYTIKSKGSYIECTVGYYLPVKIKKRK